MPLPLDYLVFVAVLVLTLTLLLANYVAYLARGHRRLPAYVLGTLLSGLAIGALFGPAMTSLGDQYGTAAILARWGFPFGWAFLLSLGASGAAVLERGPKGRPKGRIAISLTIVATLLLGFALVGGLIFSPEALPPLPASLVNLGLAALLTAVFKWVLEKRQKKKGFFERLAELFRG